MIQREALQHLILPDLDVCQELDLYVRCWAGSAYAYGAGELRLQPFGQVIFDTLYGGFSIGKWREVTGLSQLRIELSASGSGELAVWHYRAGHPRRLVTAMEVAPGQPWAVEIPVSDDDDGILAPSITAWEPTIIRGGAWLTGEAPRRTVRLGIVITTFRRETAVKATVARLSSWVTEGAPCETTIIVVDNGRTMLAEDVPGATLIPSPNLGGSGGFARGLAYLQDTGGFTHAVFMDDDAATELESVRRAIQLLRYARGEATAIVSALLFEEYPGIQLEAAGQMPADAWIPARPRVDLRRVECLIDNELPFRVDYGGWWLFFFPLRQVRHLPFPFFVRGDDVDFPRANDFELVTLNGIASFGPDFYRKESPVNVALDRRGNLVNVLLHGSTRHAWLGVLRGLQKAIRLANRYCYDHVDALAEGTRDVLAGPQAFEDLAGFVTGRRRELAACVRQPRCSIDELRQYPQAPPRHYSSMYGIVRLLLCNGHLLPRFLLIRTPCFLKTVWDSEGAEVFLRPRVLIHEGLDNQVILADRDVRRYFGSLARVGWLSLRLALAIPRLRRAFRETRSHFGSRPYWDSQFRAEATKER
jgi:hypothetical protein